MAFVSVASPATSPLRIGVDVGGSSIKAGLVELSDSPMLRRRAVVATPQPATPDAIARAVCELIEQLLVELDGERSLKIGVALPTVVKEQRAYSAANIHPSWVGQDLVALFDRALSATPLGERHGGAQWCFLNDADAAGVAEFHHRSSLASMRSSQDATQPRLFLTFGTGIGSALFLGNTLYPNTELGHLPLPASPGDQPSTAERWASAAVKTREGLSYPDWARRVSVVLNTYFELLHPREIIVGGAISAEADQWIPLLALHERAAVKVTPARYLNDAGVIGAAREHCLSEALTQPPRFLRYN